MSTRDVFDLFDIPAIFKCAGCVYESIPGNEAPCKICINHNHFRPMKSCTTCKHGDLRADEGVCAECNGRTHHEPEEEPTRIQRIISMKNKIEDEPWEENPGCIDCIYRERAPDDEPCEDCVDFDKKKLEESCSNCVNAGVFSDADPCSRCEDGDCYVDSRKLNAAIDEATDDQQSCHRCIHIGMGFNSTSNEGACADCEEHSNFKQNARQIVFASQVGGSHYKNPDVPEGFPDPAEFCIMHGLGGAETAVIKYVFRHNRKDGVKDLKKAKQYLEFIAACRYNEII